MQGISYEEYRLSVKEMVSYGGQGLLYVGILSFVFYRSVWVFLAFTPAGIGYPFLIRKDLKKRRLEQLRIQFKDAILALASCLNAGYSVENAFVASLKEMDRVYGNESMISEEIRLMIHKTRVNRTLEEAMMDFAVRSGLDDVKSYIRSLQAHVLINQRRRQQGLKTTEISKHMIFTGNPGTGKTTIARLFARYMKAIGALSQGQLVEVTRADLVAKYVGQPAPLTMSVIRSALGGVLFIDEAYSLYRGRDDSFGLEAIDTLVKAMEDNRDDLIVILAGYKKEMAAFLEANSGLKSRFPNIIEFPDYTGEQLMAIADQIAKGKGYRIDDSVKAPLTAWFDQKQAESAATAGNGRLARNTIEEAILRQSERLLKEENADMDLLKKEDFSILKEMEQAE